MGPRRVSKVGSISIHEYADETNELVAKSGRLNRAVATWTVTGYGRVRLFTDTGTNSGLLSHAHERATYVCVYCADVSASATLAPTELHMSVFASKKIVLKFIKPSTVFTKTVQVSLMLLLIRLVDSLGTVPCHPRGAFQTMYSCFEVSFEYGYLFYRQANKKLLEPTLKMPL